MFAIQKSDMDLRRTLFSNIVLSGGSTLFKGWSLPSAPSPRKLPQSCQAQTPREMTRESPFLPIQVLVTGY